MMNASDPVVNPEQIFVDIEQMVLQYKAEVPGKRKTWPESIKRFVRELCGLGFTQADIAKRTGISYYTILNWAPVNKENQTKKAHHGSYL